MKYFLLIALVAAEACLAEPKLTYVGDGRYVCSGSRADCAATEHRNAQRESLRQQERSQRDLLEEQRKQTAILEEMRNQGQRR